jgi:hypothetical protein
MPAVLSRSKVPNIGIIGYLAEAWLVLVFCCSYVKNMILLRAAYVHMDMLVNLWKKGGRGSNASHWFGVNGEGRSSRCALSSRPEENKESFRINVCRLRLESEAPEYNKIILIITMKYLVIEDKLKHPQLTSCLTFTVAIIMF